jgi:isoaspartyl peptidase/L-asparaginase-like protein (Ntn-hydrolase superfamily)
VAASSGGILLKLPGRVGQVRGRMDEFQAGLGIFFNNFWVFE